MGILRRRRFKDLVRRQLSLFDAEHGALVAQARAALRHAGGATDPHDELERFARFEDLSEDLQDQLETMCDSYAATLEEDVAARYLHEFERQAKSAYSDVVPRLRFNLDQ